MKSLKLRKGIQINLIVLLVILTVMIVLGIVFSNKVIAGGTCHCGGQMVFEWTTEARHAYRCQSCDQLTSSLHYGGEHSNGGRCTVCDYQYLTDFEHSGGTHANGGKCTTCNIQYQTHEKERWGYYANKTSAGHEIHYACTYSGCTYVYKSGTVIAHSGGTHEEGKCEDCGYKYQTHSQSGTIKNYTTTGTTHTPIYACTYSGCTSTYSGTSANHSGGTHAEGKCTVCGEKYQNHGQSTTIKNYITTDANHTPIYKCTESTCSTTYNGTAVGHSGQTHNNDGKCTTCGHQYVLHAQSSTIKGYKAIEAGHLPVYTCTQSTTDVGCTSTYDGNVQAHIGGTHDNDGICTFEGCGYKYQTHEQSNIIKEYKTAQTGHTPVYKCTETTCGTTYDGEEEIHTGGNHANDGICIVNGCGYKYQEHKATTTVTEYTDITETTHTPIYTCSHDGCTATVKGTAEVHTGGSHDNDGTCTLCGKKYQTHEQTKIISEYMTHNSIHIPLYKCSDSECISLYIGLAEKHTGATHENEGKCVKCTYQYEEHGISEEFAGYETTETGHTKLYKCTFENCQGTLKVGEEESHIGGEHDNDGTCTICNYQYQIHGLSEEQVGYETTQTGHTKLYKCSYIGCEKTLKVGEEESHTGGEHDNDGKCITCNYQYEIHMASDEILDYEKTEEGHIPKYKCTFEDCEGVHLGANQLHVGGTHENEGKCEVCTYQYQTHQKSDEIAEYTTTQENHIPVYKCIHTECTSTYIGEEQNHIGATHENDGKCEVCTYQYQIHQKSDEIIEYETSEQSHTPIYKCLYPECTGTHEGIEENHIVEEWQDSENGLHSGECKLCEYEIIDEHHYNEDGLCNECDARIPEDECNHTYEIQKNETHHWKMCPKCQLTETGSLELHKYENYTENEDGTHSTVCTVCEYELEEKHNYGDDGICEECETRVPSDECEHNYEMKNDENYHWKYCPKCETIEQGTKQNHTYENYVDNGDGTHSRTCTICKYTKTESHTENCTDCKENESTPGTGDNAATGDETVVDKEIPKAGIQNIIMMLILAVVVISVVTMIKMKKYKDI